MSENTQQVQNQNNVADDLSDGVWGLNIHSDDNKGGDEETQPILSYPVRPGEPDCVYYLRNRICGYGSNCRFNHPTFLSEGTENEGELPQRVEQPDCGYFIKTGRCKYGPTCKFNHPKDKDGAKPVSFNALGLPIREEEISCAYYMRMRHCKYGAFCKFHHPQLEKNGAASLGHTESSRLHLSGLSTWSMPTTSYPQNVSQVSSLYGWNTYMVNDLGLNTGSSTSMYDSSSNTLLSTFISHLPERPGQPECRYFVNTGNCKYGPDCKFNHPKERISQLASLIGPFGLPLRPGQIVCSNYYLYGLCNFGPTCKYDHPLQGYSYGYWNMSSLGTANWNKKPLFARDTDHTLNPITSSPTSTDIPCLSHNNDYTSNTEAFKYQSESVKTSSHSEKTFPVEH